MMNEQLHVEVTTPAARQLIEQASSCSAPGVLGRFQILPNHTAFISELTVGEVKVEQPEGAAYFAVSGGFLEVIDNRVLLLLESAEAAEEIDIDRAERAKDRADNRLEHRNSDDVDVSRAQAALARALNRLKVASRIASLSS